MHRILILGLLLINQISFCGPPQSIEEAFFIFSNPNSNLSTMQSCISFLSKQNLKPEELKPLETFVDKLQKAQIAVPDYDRIEAIGETGRIEAAKTLMKNWEKRPVDADYEQYSELELRFVRKIYASKSQTEAKTVDEQISNIIAKQIDATNTTELVEPLHLIAKLRMSTPAFDFENLEGTILKKAITAKNPDFQKWIGIIVARLNRANLITALVENQKVSPNVLSNMVTRLSAESIPLLKQISKDHPAQEVRDAANSTLEKFEITKQFHEQIKDPQVCNAILELINSMKISN